MANSEYKYAQSQAEKRTAAYTSPLENDPMAKANRKTFMTAAFYVGIAIGLFAVGLVLPDIDGTTNDSEVIDVLSRIGYALIGASALLMIALFFAKGLSKMLMFILNWLVLPAVLIDGLLQLVEIFSAGGPQV